MKYFSYNMVNFEIVFEINIIGEFKHNFLQFYDIFVHKLLWQDQFQHKIYHELYIFQNLNTSDCPGYHFSTPY